MSQPARLRTLDYDDVHEFTLPPCNSPTQRLHATGTRCLPKFMILAVFITLLLSLLIMGNLIYTACRGENCDLMYFELFL